MDRRYREARMDGGRGANLSPEDRYAEQLHQGLINRRDERSDALLRQHLERARVGARSARSYGGSTGGSGGTEGSGAGGMRVFAARQEEARQKGQIFRREGGGVFGARAERGRAFVESRRGQ